MQNNGERNAAKSIGEQSVLHHHSENILRNNVPRKVPSPMTVTSHAGINDQDIYRNPPTQRPPSAHSPNQCFSSVASPHDLNRLETTDLPVQSSQPCSHSRNRNIPRHADEVISENRISENSFHEHKKGHPNNYQARTRQLELAQATADPQRASNDYEAMCQKRYASFYEKYRQQDYSNSVNPEYQLQEGQMDSQLQQPYLPIVNNRQSSYGRDGLRNERNNVIYINGYRVKKNVKVDSRSTLSSPETLRSEVRGPKTENSEGVERFCSTKGHVCQVCQEILQTFRMRLKIGD